ncbi:MAG: cellulose binding domain-containing protein [Actinomycetota bacterium]
MVDLREALRPEPTETAPPLADIAARARRRRRRRHQARAGAGALALVALLVGYGAFPRSSSNLTTVADPAVDPPTAATTPDGSPDRTAAPSVPTSRPVGGDEAPDGAAPSAEPGAGDADGTDGDGERPVTTPGIATTSVTTSSWEGGYCLQIEVVNETSAQQRWQVVLDEGGSVAEVWNAEVEEVDDVLVFTGEEGFNPTVDPSSSTGFGACIDRD